MRDLPKMIKVVNRGMVGQYTPRPFYVKNPKKIAWWIQMSKWYPMDKSGHMGCRVTVMA